ncbi:MAG: efflux RND transporter periplasmic adaptor subunit [Alphaproteobacteria bacterium]|nr:efflux RND transporter periplasmic adaptor subunit [Alphaproteobacteria bacterium]
MATLFKRFGFAAVVTLVIGAMAFVVVGKTLFGKEEAGGPAVAAKAGPPGAGKGGPKGGGDMPVVVAGTVAQSTFHDTVQAIGTAQARESVIIGAKVTDVISRIRFDSGDRVTRGQILVELASTEQFADLEEARASREAARRDYDRFRELGEKGFAPAQRVEQARAGFEQAEARVRAQQARVGDRTIRAPFSGVMGLRTASPGALVRPGDQIGTLDDISEIKLDFDVSESQFGQIRAGSEIAATTTAHPGKTFTGRVADIDSRVNTQSRTVRVRAIIPNREGLLKPGMLMSVEARSNPRQALGAPEIAVLERADGSYLFTLEEKEGKPTAALTFVRTGKRSGGLVEIVSGAELGTRIVVEGVQRVRSGQAVRIEVRPAAVAPAAAPPPAPVAPAKAPVARRQVAPTPTAPTTTESELRGRVQEPVAPPQAAAPGGQLPPVPAD